MTARLVRMVFAPQNFGMGPLRAVFVLAASIAAVGCEVSGDPGGELVVPPSYKTEACLPPDAGPSDSGLPPCYPPPPYGVAVGEILRDYELAGLVNSVADRSTKTPIGLREFYNPTGADVYPSGSKLGEGLPKPKALLVNVSARWCQPCKQEAASVLPKKYAELKPRGAEFYIAIAEGKAPGSAVAWEDLEAWTKSFKINYPCVFDPDGELGGLFPPALYPANMIVDTRTMAIVEVVLGAPDEAFWERFDTVLEK